MAPIRALVATAAAVLTVRSGYAQDYADYADYAEEAHPVWAQPPPDAPAPPPPIDWTYLTQSDFDRGTVRLRKRGNYKLASDISFNPNPDPDNGDWMPACPEMENPPNKYCWGDAISKPYKLGFFAAITMEGNGIVLDLDGHTLSQHPEHRLQQRFFSLIELANKPFNGTQGPQIGGFGNYFRPCTNCVFTNGVISASSHHGIHGNGPVGLTISDVVFDDYEVACISLHGAKEATIKNVQCLGSATSIPVRATYSAARFLLHFLKPHMGLLTGPEDQAAKDALEPKIAALEALMADVLTVVQNGGQLVPGTPAYSQFALPEAADGVRAVDGNAYGIVISSAGVVVGNFKESFSAESPAGLANSVTMENVYIKNVVSNVNEVPTISQSSGLGFQVDTAGATVRLGDITDAEGRYVADPLHDLRFELAYWSYHNDVLADRKAKARLGTLNIDLNLAEWARGGGGQTIHEFINERNTVHGDNYVLVCNMDSMTHRQKGSIGLFFQASDKLKLKNVEVDGVTNYGYDGGPPLCNASQYVHARGTEGTKHVGYNGCQARGMVLTSSKNSVMEDVTLKDISSQHCEAYGVHVFGDVSDTVIRHPLVGPVISGDDNVLDYHRWTSRYVTVDDPQRNVTVIGAESMPSPSQDARRRLLDTKEAEVSSCDVGYAFGSC